MHTTLGEDGFQRYICQTLRWARTTWRSNSTSFFRERVVWRSQPWYVYGVYFWSFVNFALIMDLTLMGLGKRLFGAKGLRILGLWILQSKSIKLVPHFIRNPGDIAYFPIYVAFAYFHSILKLWALLTIHNSDWGQGYGFLRSGIRLTAVAPEVS